METVIAAIEMAGLVFKCGVVLCCGLYVLKCYRNYRVKSAQHRLNNRVLLNKRGLA